tara:strand:- start:1540 stop:1824 length:285 start_codon:yes stop_codon:yes gene_type:complete
MTVKRDSRGRLRDYKKEYDRDHKPSKDKKDRASRNAARKKVVDYFKKNGKSVPKNKDVDHKDGNPRNNSSENTRLMDRSKNRGRSNIERSKKKR